MKKLVLQVLGGKEAIRKALEEAILEALQEALEEEAEAPRVKAKRKAKPEAEAEKAQAMPQAMPQAEASKAKAPRRKGPKADSGEARALVKALADLGAAVGPREAELLTRRGETLMRKAKPGQAPRVLAGVLEHLRGLTLPEVARAARLGYYDLAVAAGVGSLVEPPKA